MLKKIPKPSLQNTAFTIAFLVIPTPIFDWPHVVTLLILTGLQAFSKYLTHLELKQDKIIEANAEEASTRLAKIEYEITQLNNALTFRNK